MKKKIEGTLRVIISSSSFFSTPLPLLLLLLLLFNGGFNPFFFSFLLQIQFSILFFCYRVSYEFDRALPSFTGFFLTLVLVVWPLDEPEGILPGFTGFYWIFPSFSHLFRSLTTSYRVLPSFSRLCFVFLRIY